MLAGRTARVRPVKERGRSLGAVVLLAGIGTLAACASASAAPVATFSNPQPISIPASGNGSPYPSTIVVSGLSGLITDVNVTIKSVSHTRPDDLAVVLVGPSGQALLLQSGAGAAPDLVDVTTVFDDSAPSQLPNPTAWPSGSYKPTGYYVADSFPAPGPGTTYSHPGPAAGGSATLGSTFTGTNANGTWRLYVGDFQAGESGSIVGGWSLQLQTTIADTEAPDTTIVAAPGATTASSTANISFSANESATFECTSTRSRSHPAPRRRPTTR